MHLARHYRSREEERKEKGFMAEAISEIINSVLMRLRDPAGTATSRALILDILLRAQQVYNEALRLSLLQVTYSTTPFTQFFPLTPDLQLSSLSHIRHNERDLCQVTFADLMSIDRKWHRALSNRYECYMPLGFTHFLLWPGLRDGGTVTLIGPAMTQNPVSDTASLEISQERTPLLIQLTELILTNRMQDEAAFKAILPSFQAFLPQQQRSSRG